MADAQASVSSQSGTLNPALHSEMGDRGENLGLVFDHMAIFARFKWRSLALCLFYIHEFDGFWLIFSGGLLGYQLNYEWTSYFKARSPS